MSLRSGSSESKRPPVPCAQQLQLHPKGLLVAVCRPVQLAAGQVEAPQVVQAGGNAHVMHAVGLGQDLQGLQGWMAAQAGSGSGNNAAASSRR